MTDNELYEKIAQDQSWPGDEPASATVLRAERDAARAEAESLRDELARVQSDVAAMREGMAPLLPEWPAIPWHADPHSETGIVGAWYHIESPAQLRPYIIKMQNRLSTTAGRDLLERLEKAEAAQRAIETALVETGTSPEPVDGDWKKAINTLIDWHVRVSHDPRVNGSEQEGAE